MPNTSGKNNRVIFGAIGAAGTSGSTIAWPTPDTGRIYLLDWFNICVRNAAVGNAYLEIVIPILEGGASNVVLNFALADVVAAGGTYSIIQTGLGIPVNNANTGSVTLRDNTGAASLTTATNGLIIGAWGLKHYPYID